MESTRDQNGDCLLTVVCGSKACESQIWTETLLQMYLKWAENQGYESDIIDRVEGVGNGVGIVTVDIRGHDAYKRLKTESGVHRLVRVPPTDEKQRRHTSYATVSVIPASPVRSYILDPYLMVKDERTGREDKRVDEFLGGNLELLDR